MEPAVAEKNPISLKERMKIARTAMPELDPATRSRGFEEVNLGFAAPHAIHEAMRCLSCAKPGCVVQCPVGVKIKEIVELICAGAFLSAAAKMREDNPLPAVTGRVCPQENQCEGGCVLGRKGQPVAIGNLERFIADFERESGQLGLPVIAPPTGKSVQAWLPPVTSSRRATACVYSKRCTKSAAYWSTAYRSFACPNRS
jgi:glutamate synthase (NADPH/NADH) small chain